MSGTGKTKSFSWAPGDEPPPIEAHSKAKLNVLREYLNAYFDRMGVHRGREEIRLDLVDGFAGGGIFHDNGKEISGSPLVMLEASNVAKQKLNKPPRKPLHLNCHYYFVDKEKHHTDYLKRVLNKRNYDITDRTIDILHKSFDNAVDSIIASIKKRQPRAGRSIFLLDQTGFGGVPLALIRKILQELASAEIILTIAVDAFLNHLSPNIQIPALELSTQKIEKLKEARYSSHGLALAQRMLVQHIGTVINDIYYTPFIIKPAKSRRSLLFMHLSRHPTARNEMMKCHWKMANTFTHYGSAGFEMLSFDALESHTISLFNFDEDARKIMDKTLIEALPHQLYSLASDEGITRDALRHKWANETPARYEDMDRALQLLVREGEFSILDPNGKERSKNLKNFQPTDRLIIPRQTLLPGLSRRKK